MSAELLALLLLASGAPLGSSGSPGGLVWRHDSGTGLAVVALGDRGGQVATHGEPSSLVLLSSFDADPPTPVWESRRAEGLDHIEASALSDVYLYGDYRLLGPIGPSQGTLRLWRSSSRHPVWSYDFVPQMFSFPAFDLSEHGDVVVSGFTDKATSQTEIRRHDPASGVPVQSFVLPIPLYISRFEVSSDGSTLAASGIAGSPDDVTEIVDLATETVVFTTPGRLSKHQSLSRGGLRFAVRERIPNVGSHVRVFTRSGSSYTPILDKFTRPDLDPFAWALSDDGSTLAVAWFDWRGATGSVLRAFDLSTGSVTMERNQTSQGLQNVPADLAISADGSRFVAGLWGDVTGSIAELAVYSPSSPDPLVEYPDGGSVVAVDVSPDGKRFVASRAATHVNGGYNGTSIELYEFGGEDFLVHGRPSIGATVAFDLHGTPSASAFVLSSPALAPVPIDYPGLGRLFLDPSSLSAARAGTIPPTGVATYPLAIPNDPSQIGRTMYFQGMTMAPRSLTSDWVQLTILP